MSASTPASDDLPHSRGLRAAVVVPVFNHADRLGDVLAGVGALELPLIVVDDGSTDAAPDFLHEWVRQQPPGRVRLVRHARNRGKGAALRTGFAEARCMDGTTHAVTIDADGQLSCEDIPRLLAAAASRPRALVLGVRPEEIAHRPGRCAVGRAVAGAAALAQTGRRLRDTQCGLRVYPLELIEAVPCRAGRFSFEAEIIARAAWAGFEIVEVDVGCVYFEKAERVSHFRPVVDTLRQARLHSRLIVGGAASGHLARAWMRTRADSRAAGHSEAPLAHERLVEANR